MLKRKRTAVQSSSAARTSRLARRRGRHRESARQPLGAEKSHDQEALRLDPEQELLCPRRQCARHLNGVAAAPSSRPMEHTVSPLVGGVPEAPEWDAACRRIGRWSCPSFAGQELATLAAERRSCSVQARRATMIGGAGDLVESTYTGVRWRSVSGQWGGPQQSRFGIRSTPWLIVKASPYTRLVSRTGDFLIFSDYMRPQSPLGADGLPGRLGVDARFVRARRGRPDAPPSRLRGAARDPEPCLRARRPTRQPGREVALERADGRLRCRSRGKGPTLDRSDLHPHQARARRVHTVGSGTSPRPYLIDDRRRGRVTSRRTELADDGTTVRSSRCLLGAFEAQPST